MKGYEDRRQYREVIGHQVRARTGVEITNAMGFEVNLETPYTREAPKGTPPSAGAQ